MKTAGCPLGYNRQSCSEKSDLARQPGTSGFSVRAADENGCGPCRIHRRAALAGADLSEGNDPHRYTRTRLVILRG
jgi:hypothetical protein